MRGFRTFFGFPFTIRISGSRSSLSATKRDREHPPSNPGVLKFAARPVRTWREPGGGLCICSARRLARPRNLTETGETCAEEDREAGDKETCRPRSMHRTPLNPTAHRLWPAERRGTETVTRGRVWAELRPGGGGGGGQGARLDLRTVLLHAYPVPPCGQADFGTLDASVMRTRLVVDRGRTGSVGCIGGVRGGVAQVVAAFGGVGDIVEAAGVVLVGAHVRVG